MTPYDPSFSRFSPLGAQRLRELVRASRGRFAPDHVGRVLRHHSPAPVENDVEEIADLLGELITTARDKLYEAGMVPAYDDAPHDHKLPKRERDYAANLAALLAYYSLVLMHRFRLEEAFEAGREGLAWCRIAEDFQQQSIQWRVIAAIHHAAGDLAGEERAYRSALEAARISKQSEEIVAALNELCALLVVRWCLDEAETLVEEALLRARKEVEDEVRRWYYPELLMNKGRVQLYRTHYQEGIRTLREALRWADGERNPHGRASVLTHLGSIYLRLEQFRLAIECQHEVVQLAEAAGSAVIRGWGYYRLAEAHLRLNALDAMRDMLDRAEENATGNNIVLRLAIAGKRAQLYTAEQHFDEAVRLCRWMIDTIGTLPHHDLAMFAHTTLGEIEERRGKDEAAVLHYRNAIEIADREFPARSPSIKISLAWALHRLGRGDEVGSLLEEVKRSDALNLTEQAKTLRLQAAIAEQLNELQSVIEFERDAFALERSILEQQAEQSLRNARIVAEIDLLERDADLERERRRRLERELADAIVELGDRRRLVESAQQRLRKALAAASGSQEKSVTKVLRETLATLRSEGGVQESPLHYLSGIDEEFYTRLRKHCADLTPKQERLCGLLRAGLASREIASLMGLAPEGLKAQRKRLRKKLGLGTDDSLEKMLGEI